MNATQKEHLVTAVANLIRISSLTLSDDVSGALAQLMQAETGERAKTMYACIADNLRLASALSRPICQDTGLLQFFLEVGTAFPYMDDLKEVLTEATVRATKETPLRPNVVEPLGDNNTGDNTGYGAPYLHYDLVPHSADLRLRLYLSGGGCALPGRSRVLMPLEGAPGIRKFVCETVAEWGVNACPPLVVGIGIGACAASAAELSKKALLRRVGSRNPDAKLSALEEQITDDLNALGIAPLGFGGSATVLGVSVEAGARHPATLGVGLSFGCWATRRAEMVIHPDLTCEILSHRQVTEETR